METKKQLYLKMMSNFVVVFLFAAGVLLFQDVNSSRSSSCPCSDEKLCERITKEVDKEVLVWSTSDKVWQHYNWSVVTTVAVFGDWNNELMCFAHSKVIFWTSYDKQLPQFHSGTGQMRVGQL